MIKIAVKIFISIACLSAAGTVLAAQPAGNDKPLRVGVAGISHGHLWDVISRADRGDFIVVGVAEPDEKLRTDSRWVQSLDPEIVFSDLSEMIEATAPEVIVAYGSIYEHVAVVEAAAPLGVHVMVEKPLAVNMEHAVKMERLARENNIRLVTNYETTWYPSNRVITDILENNGIGKLTRINVYDGHQGPVEIGCGPEFLTWLTDPVLNGGGAVVDFGCYGANLATWLMDGEEPRRVSAVLKQLKPEIYPNVDDDATIILEYDDAVVQVMGSWAWPMGRKDMHIYGLDGYIYQDNATDLRVLDNGAVRNVKAPALAAPYNDPYLYLKAVVRGQITMSPSDQSALENNMTVVKILDAARESAHSGRAVEL
ncbi:MAG: Gfo/Idh/MocA family oxidoreductase [Rikenellaceae bacterium]|nr:Gfo/Idh/MocA family oxidoreductase [Rikenellaceae bacterium]